MRHSLYQDFGNPTSIVPEPINVVQFAMCGFYVLSRIILGSRSVMPTCMHLCGEVEWGRHTQINCHGCCWLFSHCCFSRFTSDSWMDYIYSPLRKPWDLEICSFDEST